MARTRRTTLAFDALTLEGNLIAPAMLAKVAAREAGGQAEADYGIKKGLTLRDEIARYFRIAQALFDDLHTAPEPSTAATITFVEALLRDVFEFGDVARAGTRTLNDREYAVTLEAKGGRVPVVAVPPSDDLDRASDHLPTDSRRRSAASAIQDWLNANDDALWGLCTNGDRLRLVRDNASLTRPAYIEADLARMFEDDAFADFTAFWLLVHASRFGAVGTPVTDCALERWRDAGAKEGVAAKKRLGASVELALLALGGGFLSHPGNADLRARLEKGELPLADYFSQLLRVIYRLIFLLAAEDRNLLHPPKVSASARTLYAQGYSLSQLRERAIRRASWDRHTDQWEGLRIVFASLASGESRLGLPALGGLFAPGAIPDLDVAALPNRALMEAIYRLAWLSEDDGIVLVNWRDMETEELGSVYEGLLELTPRLTDEGRGFAFAEGAETRGNARKTSGSYYTPDSLVQLLLDSALDPVLDRVEREADDVAAALLGVTVIDPACGSGHFLLAAARRLATRLARSRAGGVASAEDYRHALRDVVRSCIHGVDLNPMAVELCKVALWIEALEPGRPLSFLENHIRCGDSLVGVFDYGTLKKGLPDEAFDPLTGDDKAVAKAYAVINKEQRDGKTASGLIGELRMPAEITSGAERLLSMPEDTLEEIEAKRKAFERLISGQTWWRLKAACDMYVAAFLMPKTGEIPDPRKAARLLVPTTEAIWRTVQGGDIRGDVQAAAIDFAERNSAFHWPLEFPLHMAKGGFDAVVGNPPWERIKLQEQEFFAARDAEIAMAPNKSERDKLIKELKKAEPGTAEARLSAEFDLAKRSAEAASVFVRKTGRYPLTGTGDVNTYALFAEHFARLARKGTDASPSGRAGVIVPTGIATDSSTSAFFGDLVAGNKLAALYDFENREKLFPAVDSRVKFSILAIGQADRARFAAFLLNPAGLEEAERQVELVPDDFRLFNPNTLTAPLFRSRHDKELTRKLYRAAPVLIRERSEHSDGDDNPWGISIQSRLWHMAEDSAWFLTGEQLSGQGFYRDGPDWQHQDGRRYVPLFEAKMIHHFDHRFGSYAGLDARPGDGSLPETPASLKANTNYEAEPWYWVPEEETKLRVARVPTRLKQYFRKENTTGCLKVLAEWVLGSLDTTSLGSTQVTKYLLETLGESAISRDVIGAKVTTWLNKVEVGARKMQRETPLSEDDLAFIRQGPSAPLELSGALIDRKQPRWLMGWRDICRSTDERTVVGGVYPKAGSGHNLPVWHPDYGLGADLIAALVADLSSMALDYAARQKVAGTHLNFFYAEQLPVLAPHQFTREDLAFITPRVLELTYTSHSMAKWAEDLGHTGTPFGFDPERRATLRADLDAFFARKYGLSRDELRYILDPADVKSEAYPSETFRGLKRNEEAAFGEYRTQRLVLDAWDRMERGGLRDTFPTIVVAGTPEPKPFVARIDPATLPDNAWVRPRTDPSAETGLFLAALLKTMDGPLTIREMRMAAVLGLEPRVFGKVANDTKTLEWRRLVGTEAEPLPDNVWQLPSRNSGWFEATLNLRGNGHMIEDLKAGTWAPGKGLDKFETAGWADGRAEMVLDVVRQMAAEDAVERLPVELKEWVNAA